jgi:hypothetical protein
MPNYNPSPATRFKKGQSGNPAGRPKGSRNYRTLFREAYMAIAKDLRLGKEPDALLVEILKRGIREALKGNYPFYKDIMDRLYGKPKERIDAEEGKKLLVLVEENDKSISRGR